MIQRSIVVIALFVAGAATVSAREPNPAETWPGFRGHEMTGVAPSAKLPDRWSTTDHVKWAVPIAGHGWSSPIVWGDTVFMTSAISSQPVQEADARSLRQRLHRGAAGAGTVRRGDHEAGAGARQRAAGGGRRDPLHGLRARRARPARSKWEREAHQDEAVRRPPSQEHLRVRDAGHRRRAPLRLVRPERRPLRAIRSTARCCGRSSGRRSRSTSISAPPRHRSSHDGRVYLLHDNEEPTRTSPRSTRRPARSCGARRDPARAFR